MTEDQIKSAFNGLNAARQTMHDAFIGLRDAKNAYEDARNKIVRQNDPKELGQNEAIRTAVIESRLTEMTDRIRQCELAEYDARLAFDIAQNNVRCIEVIIEWTTRNT